MRYWNEFEGTPFVIAQALACGNDNWNNQAKKWLKTKDGKEFYGRLKKTDSRFIDKALNEVFKNG